MIQKDIPLSEPEGEYSDCSSYEELSSNSETEEVILFEKEPDNKSPSSSSTTSASNYRSWYSSSKRRGSRASNNLSVKSSKDSLTVINEKQKNWWYWMKLVVFISTPFIARQLGIMVGKRILKDGNDNTLTKNALIVDISTEYSDEEGITKEPSGKSPTIPVIDMKDEASVKGVLSDPLEDSTSLFPHTVGIRNHINNCYASALIACLYNIPVVQKAIFDEFSSLNLRKEDSIISALATIFYKMRFGRSFIDLEPFFIPAVKKSFVWEFGGIQCVLDFWDQLSAALPVSLFQIEFIEHRIRKSDNVIIKSVLQKSNLILVSPSLKYKNIEEFLENNFIDEEAEDYIIKPEDIQEYSHLFTDRDEAELIQDIKIPSMTSLTISNCPEVLIFGVKRVRWNSETQSSEFDSTPLGFPEKLTINSEEYTIVGNVEYDEERVHYYAQNYDLLDDQWYIHDDKLVTRIPDTEEDFTDLAKRFIHCSSMVFYVKTSSLERFKGEERVDLSQELVTKLKSRARTMTTAAATTSSLKRKRNEDTKATDIEEVISNNTINNNTAASAFNRKKSSKDSKVVKKGKVPSSIKKQSKAIEVEEGPIASATSTSSKLDIKQNQKHQKETNQKEKPSALVEVTSFFESSLGPVADFRLGSKQYLFSQTDRNVVLEPILMTFASHPKLVKKLFEIVKGKAPIEFEFKFALVVLKMLVGHMAISVKELTRILKENYSVDFDDFGMAWRKISQIISPEISLIPDLKIVTYKNDEPISIETIEKCKVYSLKPLENLKIPRNLKLFGPAYDTIIDTNEGIYNRNILKNSGEGIILPIPIERIFKDPASNNFIYDGNDVDISTGSYIIHGFIGLEQQSNRLYAIFSDHLCKPRYLTYISGIPLYREKTPPLLESVVKFMKNQSILFFLTKKEGFYEEMPMLSNVPRILFDEMTSSD